MPLGTVAKIPTFYFPGPYCKTGSSSSYGVTRVAVEKFEVVAQLRAAVATQDGWTGRQKATENGWDVGGRARGA